MSEDVESDSADWIEWTEQIECVGRAEPEDGFITSDNHERLYQYKQHSLTHVIHINMHSLQLLC